MQMVAIRLLVLNHQTFPLLSICGELTSVHTTLCDLCVLTAITAPLRMASPFIPDVLIVSCHSTCIWHLYDKTR